MNTILFVSGVSMNGMTTAGFVVLIHMTVNSAHTIVIPMNTGFNRKED